MVCSIDIFSTRMGMVVVIEKSLSVTWLSGLVDSYHYIHKMQYIAH